MPTSFTVIDNFFEDPMEVREAALKLDYPDLGPRAYAGRTSRQPLIIRGIEEIVSQVVGEPLIAAKGVAHGHCRVALDGDDERQLFHIHIDDNVWWSGILYLTLPQHCRGGTEFYRHKETASDHAPLFKDELAKAGARNFGEAGNPIVVRDHNDRTKWEHLMTIPMRFNRLVLLRPWLWHAAGKSFGTSIENGRLVQLFFFVPPTAF